MRAKPQRVLMTADTVGGVWTYCVELARALEPHGVDVALATMGGSMSAAQLEQVSSLRNVQVYESEFKLEWMQAPWSDVERAGDWLLTLENDLSPDVIHLNGYAHGSLPWREPHLVVGHSCVLSWWRAVKREAAPEEEWSPYRGAVSRGLQSADMVAAPSRAMLAELQRYYGPLSNTIVIPNARDSGVYAPAETKRPFVLAAGRLWDEAKNIATLDVVAADIGWPVLVAGDARHPNGARFEARNVHVLGSLSERDLAARMAEASIYALPARYEPFGLSALEAALSGCALVLGDIPSLRENWDGAAFFCDPDDPASLRAALMELTGCEARRRMLAQAARARATSFHPARMGAAYLCAYRQLMMGNSLPAMAQ